MIQELIVVASVCGGWLYLIDKTDKIKNPWVKLAVHLVMLILPIAGLFT